MSKLVKLGYAFATPFAIAVVKLSAPSCQSWPGLGQTVEQCIKNNSFIDNDLPNIVTAGHPSLLPLWLAPEGAILGAMVVDVVRLIRRRRKQDKIDEAEAMKRYDEAFGPINKEFQKKEKALQETYEATVNPIKEKYSKDLLALWNEHAEKARAVWARLDAEKEASK